MIQFSYSFKSKSLLFFVVVVVFLSFEVFDLIIFGFGRFGVKGYVTGFGNPEWKRTHEEAERTAIVVTALLKNGATCVGKTVMDEFSFG